MIYMVLQIIVLSDKQIEDRYYSIAAGMKTAESESDIDDA